MNDASALITGFLFSLSLCFDLGIVNVALMKTGIERGFRPSFLLGFGSCFGDLFYLALALLGVSFVFDIPVVKWTLWVVGTIVLLCLTWKMLRDARRPHSPNTDTAAAAEHGSPLRHIAFGAGLALSSPTVILWFAAVAGPIVAGLNLGGSAGLILFILGFFAAGLVWSLAVALLSSRFGAAAGPRMTRILSIASALLFFGFAVHVFWSGLKDLLNAA